MSTVVKAIYEDGVFKPKEPVDLEERAEVEVILPTEARPREDDRNGWQAIDELMGFIEGAPPDGSENHDANLYGRPRE